MASEFVIHVDGNALSMIDVFHDDDDSCVEDNVLDEVKSHHLQGADLNLSQQGNMYALSDRGLSKPELL